VARLRLLLHPLPFDETNLPKTTNNRCAIRHTQNKKRKKLFKKPSEIPHKKNPPTSAGLLFMFFPT
jgi:hypothetical protein